jgi:3-oxoacyl-[acyl-carrier-protein] synthase-3
MGSALLGTGRHLPPNVERLGVERPIAIEAIGPSTLAARAAAPALERLGIGPSEIDFIVFATMTPDVTFPGAGVYLQRQLGCGTVGALDVRAQCAGFLYALAIADQFIRTETYDRILVAAAEVHSSGLDYSERGAETARLFGDGAGVAVVGRGSAQGGLRSVAIHCDGRRHREYWCEYPASRQHPVRITVEDLKMGRHFPQIDAGAVREFTRTAMPEAIGEALRRSGVDPDRVDRWILSSIFPDAAGETAELMRMPPDRVDIPSLRHGHLTAAALPVALDEAISSGRVGSGSVVGLAACGAGFSWGAAILEL